MFKLSKLAAMMLVVLMFFASTSSTNAAEVVQSEKFETNIVGEVNLSLAGDDYPDDSISPFGFYLYKDVDIPSPQTYSTHSNVPATYYYEAFSGLYLLGLNKLSNVKLFQAHLFGGLVLFKRTIDIAKYQR